MCSVMSKLNKVSTGGLSPHSRGANTDFAVSEPNSIDSAGLEKSTLSSIPQTDYVQLMMLQLHRLENLERENRKLLAERDLLREKYYEQLQIVETLKSEKAPDHGSTYPSNKGSSTSSPQMPAIEDLPAIDPAEFRPLRSNENVLTRACKLVAGTPAALGGSVKSSVSWCGKKVISILT